VLLVGRGTAKTTLTGHSITDKERNLKDLFKNCHSDGMLVSDAISPDLHSSEDA